MNIVLLALAGVFLVAVSDAPPVAAALGRLGRDAIACDRLIGAVLGARRCAHAPAVLSGCATGRGGSLAGRFVQPGEPAVDFGGPPVAPATRCRITCRRSGTCRPTATRRRARSARRSRAPITRLAAALLVEAVLPTAENHLRVAEEYRRLGILDAAHDALEPRARQGAAAGRGARRRWRASGATGDCPSWGSAPRTARRTTLRDRRARRTRSGRSSTRWASSAKRARAYERALSLDPTAAWALNNLCYVEFRLGRLDEARRALRGGARSSTRRLTAAHNNLALTYAAARRPRPGARRSFSRPAIAAAARLQPRHRAPGRAASTRRPPTRSKQAIAARPTFTAAKARAHAARVRALTGDK